MLHDGPFVPRMLPFVSRVRHRVDPAPRVLVLHGFLPVVLLSICSFSMWGGGLSTYLPPFLRSPKCVQGVYLKNKYE